MPITAVAFDYGNVLSRPRVPEARARARALTQLSVAEFERYYTQHRLAYDRGTLTGHAYWAELLGHTPVPPTPKLIAQLIQLDVVSWSQLDDRVLQWARQLNTAGVQTAVLSNMPSDILAGIRRQGHWLALFDATIFSCEVGSVKPEAAIYHRLLETLRVPSERVLFIDDMWTNVTAALQMGLQGVHYHSFPRLQQVVQAAFALPPPADAGAVTQQRV